LKIPPTTIIRGLVYAYVLPFKTEQGKPLTTKFVLVDQFRREHETQEITFTWVGQSEIV